MELTEKMPDGVPISYFAGNPKIFCTQLTPFKYQQVAYCPGVYDSTLDLPVIQFVIQCHCNRHPVHLP